VVPNIRIGEILLRREVVDVVSLRQTLRDQVTSQQRLVSVMIGRALLDFDDGALALAEQLAYPAALQRHLERRDPSVVDLIPRELAQRWVVMPIGRAYDGGLVVVARDPSAALANALENATRLSVTLAVCPGIHLERLVRSVYGPLDPTTDPIPLLELDPEVQDEQLATGSAPIIMPRREGRRPRTISNVLNDHIHNPEEREDSANDQLDAVLEEIDKAFTPVAAERFAMAYVAKYWHAALLLAVADGAALGHRGVGSRLGSVDAIVFPLTSPSMLQIAYDSGATTIANPDTIIQKKLCHLLDGASAPAAAPILVGNRIHSILAVGDPIGRPPRQAVADLARLADALGGIHERLARR
jgi:type II secretion system (T2SS) protein E